MAPFGPNPEMVGNETSLRTPVSRRKFSSASTASISVSLPAAAVRSNQARKRGAAPDLAAARADQASDRVCRARRVEAHGAMRRPERLEVAREGVGLAQVRE